MVLYRIIIFCSGVITDDARVGQPYSHDTPRRSQLLNSRLLVKMLFLAVHAVLAYCLHLMSGCGSLTKFLHGDRAEDSRA